MRENGHSSDSVVIGVDFVCLLFVAVLVILTVSFAGKVPHWNELVMQLVTACMIFLIIEWVARRLHDGFFAIVLRICAVVGIMTFLFRAMDGLQHIVVNGWMDDILISIDHFFINTESTLLLQQFVNPVVTEWMMFAYIVYIPLTPLVALICYWSNGSCAANDYLLNFSLAVIACFVGFIVFPVAGPLYHQPELYSIPLDGGFFTWWGEWIRYNQHYAGGSLPSPHCAAGTIMLAMFYRYNRKLFYVSLPTFLTLYVSTVYGRYHYVWDGIAGILSAFFVLKYSPKIVAAIEHVRIKLRLLPTVSPLPESISEYE